MINSCDGVGASYLQYSLELSHPQCSRGDLEIEITVDVMFVQWSQAGQNLNTYRTRALKDDKRAFSRDVAARHRTGRASLVHPPPFLPRPAVPHFVANSPALFTGWTQH